MISKSRRVLPAVLVVVSLLGAACSGGRATTEPAAPDPAPKTAPKPDAEKPPSAPTTRTVQGFRIQVLTTPEKSAADVHAAEAETWWRSLGASQRPLGLGAQQTLLLDVAWKPPYYRVRLGAFASRAEARDALALVKRRYPDAFLVPDVVTITR